MALRGSEQRHEVERCDYTPSFDYHESDRANSHHNREHYNCVERSLCEWRERMMNDLRESTWHPSFSQLSNLMVRVIISFDTSRGSAQNGPLFSESAVSL